MFFRLGLLAICALIVALFVALPMGLMAGRAIQARSEQNNTLP